MAFDLHQLFTDFDGAVDTFDDPEWFRKSIKNHPDPELRKVQYANQRYLLERNEEGLEARAVAGNWPLYRQKLAANFGLQGEINDSQVHAAIANSLQEEKSEVEFAQKLGAKAIQNALLSPGDPVKSFADAASELEGGIKGKSAQYYGLFKGLYEEYQQKSPEFHKVFEQITRDTGEEGSPIRFNPRSREFNAFVDEFAKLDAEGQAFAMSAILSSEGVSQRDFLSAFAENFRRGGVDLLENGYLKEAMSSVDGAIEALETGGEIYVNEQVSEDAPDRFTASAPQLFGSQQLTNKQARESALSELKQRRKELVSRQRLRAFIDGDLDPTKMAGDLMIDKVGQGAIDFARFAPFSIATAGATALNPYAGFVMASGLASDHRFTAIMAENPEADARSAANIAGAQGALDGALETLGNMLLLGQFPTVRKWLAARGSGVGFVAGAAGIVSYEMVEEYMQDTGAGLISEIATVLTFDPELSEFDLSGHLSEIYNGDYASDLFFATLPFSVVGGIGGAAQKYFGQADLEAMVTKESLEAYGFPPERVAEIVSRTELKDKLDLFKENFDGKQFVENAKETISESKSVLKNSQRSADTPTVTKTAEGSYRVTRPDGVSITVGSLKEASEFVSDLPSSTDTMDINEKQGIAAIPDNPVFDWTKKNFRSRGDLPADAFAAKNISEAFNTSLKKEVEMNVKRLEGAVRKEVGIGVTPDRVKANRRLMREAQEAMTGQRQIDSLPKGVQPIVREMRAHVDRLSRQLIDEGVIQGDLELVVKENIGSYLNRSYRVFDDPNWAKNVPQDVRNRAIGYLTRQNPRRLYESKAEHRERILGIVDEILYNREGSPVEVLARGKIGSKDLSILRARKGIAPEIRALMGEYEGVVQNYAKSVFKMSALLANNRFLKSVKKTGLGTYLHKEPKKGYGKQISAEGNPSMAPLDGLYTSPEIAEAFQRNYNPLASGLLGKLYFSLNGFAKFGKTILSPITQVRNFNSNIVYSIALGNVPFAGGVQSMRTIMQDVLPDALLKHDARRKDFQQAYQRYTELGLLDESVTAGDFAGLLKDAFAGDIDLARFHENLIVSAGKKTADAATKLYQAGDGFWKITNFESERSKLMKAYPKWDDSKLDREAAQLVRDMTPTYSLVPPAIQKLRRFPFLGPFVSFASEVVRNNFNIAKRIQHELATPELKSIGGRRLAGFLTAHGITLGAAALGKMMIGASDEEEKAIRELAAPWDENANLLFLGRDEDGAARFINLSYIDPFAYFKNPLIAFGRDGDIDERIIQALGEIMSPFIGEEIVSSKALDIARNRRADTGSPVYNPQADIKTRIAKIATHMAKGIEPGFVSAWTRLYKGATGEEGNYGNTYNFGDEIIANTTGNRIAAISPETALFFRASKFDRDTNDATRLFTTVATRPGTVTEGELSEAFEQMEEARERAFNSFQRSYNAAIALGLSAEDAYEKARAGGVSKRVLEQDSYEPYKLTSHQLKKIEDKPERLALIQKVAPSTLN